MTEPTSYKIVIEGRAAAGLLRPLLDDFSFHRSDSVVTRLTGETATRPNDTACWRTFQRRASS